MRVFSAVSLAILISAGAQAQHHTGAPARVPGVPSSGALGGSFASIGMSRPLGGIAPPSFPSNGIGNQRERRPERRPESRYFGPIFYVPNAYDTTSQSSGYSTFNQPANPALYPPPPQEPAAQQPIIINQYFGSRTATTQTEGDTTTTAQTTPGDPIGAPKNYYLIAYKNHNVYSVIAYWLEGDTLHYVTTENTHNQASLALIDLDQTMKLNADNSVPFSLSGK